MLKRPFYIAIATVLLGLLGGCSTLYSFPSQVTVFSDWDAAAPKTYTFSRSESQAQSLEHKTYEAAVREVLAAKGFTEAGDARSAKLKVALSYSITPDKTRRDFYIDDPWWPYGAWGWGWGWGYWGPRWGFYGSYWPHRARAVETPWFVRELRIDISDAASGAKRYEVTAKNDTRSDQLAPAIPYLARAALDSFPQTNGSTRTVSVPIPESPAK
jgi:hypothetical protein